MTKKTNIIKRKKSDYVSSIFFAFGLFLVFVGALVSFSILTEEYLLSQEKAYELEVLKEVIDVDFDNDPIEEQMMINSADGTETITLYPIRLDGVVNGVGIKIKKLREYDGDLEIVVGFYIDGQVGGYKLISFDKTKSTIIQVRDDDFSEEISSKVIDVYTEKAYDAYKRFILGE